VTTRIEPRPVTMPTATVPPPDRAAADVSDGTLDLRSCAKVRSPPVDSHGARALAGPIQVRAGRRRDRVDGEGRAVDRLAASLHATRRGQIKSGGRAAEYGWRRESRAVKVGGVATAAVARRGADEPARAGRRIAVGALLAALGLGADLFSTCAAAQNEPRSFDPERPAIAAFIDAEVRRDGFSRAQLSALLASARARPELTVAMAHPIEKTLPWWQYRARFVTPGRIAGGVSFWHAHAKLLDRVGPGRGVPPEYLVAILGMETNYGEATGSYRELDTLMTLAFDYPARAAQYRSELRAFLLLWRDAGLDPLSTRGSYAGALGAPQFLPSSYRRYAVNSSEAARVDLWSDWPSIFASMEKFLTAHGWQQGGPVIAGIRAAPDARPTVSGHLALNDTAAGLAAKGLHIEGDWPAASPVVLVAAELEDGMSYRAGFKNLHVLASYNPSINYVLAVCDLAHELRQAIEHEAKDAASPIRP